VLGPFVQDRSAWVRIGNGLCVLGRFGCPHFARLTCDVRRVSCIVCLLPPHNRTGYESGAAAQAAAASSRRTQQHHGGGMGNGFFYSGPDEFDPEEIFNAFFG
jgi:hypothetical protein